MLEFFDFLRTDELGYTAVLIRLALAVICGGLIGIERERRGRAAGFRTHILICLGAAMTTLTSQYIVFELGLYADLSRIGAQVIAGVGFIGAGAVVVTQRKQIKGITTAAGIWTSAIVGLCFGAGFFEGALLTTVLVLFVEIVFSRIEEAIQSKRRRFSIAVEYSSPDALADVVSAIKESDVAIWGLEVKNGVGDVKKSCAIFSVRLSRKLTYEEFCRRLRLIDCVESIERV